MNDAVIGPGPVTLVLGASVTPSRYANMAVRRLVAHNIGVVALGRKPGAIGRVSIITKWPEDVQVDTVTVYLSNAHLDLWSDALLRAKPRRVVFNPGAEYPALTVRLQSAGVEVVEGCTLVMLAAGTY